METLKYSWVHVNWLNPQAKKLGKLVFIKGHKNVTTVALQNDLESLHLCMKMLCIKMLFELFFLYV